ncbi:MAG: glucose-6-phosphate dehydrogenase [Candidatus Saccharimonadales bacterium]
MPSTPQQHTGESSTDAVGPVIMVFGVTGDLSRRKILPALYHLLDQGLLPPDTKIVGISRKPLDVDELLGTVELCVLEKDKVCDPAGLARVRAALRTHQLEPDQPDDYARLRDLLDSFNGHAKRQRLFQLSIPPNAYPPIIAGLSKAGLNGPRDRLLLEKPFGYDTASAEQLIKLLAADFQEEQIYRIDHYLAKETAQNLLAFRLHNPIFNPIWSAAHIQRVHIRLLESLDIEGRAKFYEQTGAVRDIVQSHLLQLLSITLMDLPSDMSSQAIHLSKEHFLEQLLPADPAEAVRGQYTGYRTEVGNPDSAVETYALLHLQHTAERWQGTDIILETGKALTEKIADITIEFKTPHERRRNSLTFRLQPDEGIGLDLVVKEPGLENRMRHAPLELRYKNAFRHEQHIDAYERVLMDAIRGDQALFASDREVLATWQVLEPILESWHASSKGLRFYQPGSEGPAAVTPAS